MYEIVSTDGAVLYDQNNISSNLISEPSCRMELGQPGSLDFNISYDHPYYDRIGVMETYLSANDDDHEIFYGRVIDVSEDVVNGTKSVTCAGALEFLEDAEVSPFGGENNTRNLTGAQFLSLCIDAFNSQIGNDPKRNLSIGTISHSRANVSQDFNIGSYTAVNSAIQSNLIGNMNYGGYLVIRKSGSGHVIDWIEEYTELCSSPIQISVNVQEQENSSTANDFYTVIHPVGKDNLELPEVTVNISDALVAKYGRIVRNIGFTDAETVSDLRSSVNRFIAWAGMDIGKTATIKLIDMSFLDGSYPRIYPGAAYDNIEGLDGEIVVAADMQWDFEDPSNNSVTIKNRRDLNSSRGSGGGGGNGGGSSSTGSVSKAFANMYHHITETQDSLSIHAKLIELHGVQIRESAVEFERFSSETATNFENVNGIIGNMQGTGSIQNSDRITQVAGQFSVKYYRVPASKVTGSDPHAKGWYEPNNYYEVTENDPRSGIELYYSETYAMNGNPIPTDTLVVGQKRTKMFMTNDTTPVSTKHYYSKSLRVGEGTGIELTEDGYEVSVVKDIKDTKESYEVISGSALWTQRDNITGVTGEFEVRTDPNTGERRVVIKSGGGIKILENHVEYGLYDESSLTGGVIVQKINTQSGGAITRISGTMIDITADLVKIGETSNVAAWMSESDTWKDSTDETLQDYAGLIADRATIAQLNAQKARIDTIETDYLTATNLASTIARLNSVSITGSMTVSGGVSFSGAVASDNPIYASDFRSATNSMSLGNSLNDVQIVADGTTGYKLQKKTNTGSWTDAGSFSRATTLSGSWSGGIFTVTASPQGATISSELGTAGHWGQLSGESATTYYGSVNATSRGVTSYTGETFEVDALDIFSPVSLSTIKPTTAIRIDSTPVTLYEAGSGTIYDRGESVLGRETLSSGGYMYYPAGTATTYYNAGTVTKVDRGSTVTVTPISATSAIRLGSSGTYYTAGTKVRKIGNKPPVQYTGTLYVNGTISAGSGSWYLNVDVYEKGDEITPVGDSVTARPVVSSGGTIYYQAASQQTWYRGNGGSFTQQGTSVSVTPISSSLGIRLSAQQTYYRGDGGAYTPQGTAQGAYKKLDSGGTLYYEGNPQATYYTL